MKGTDMVTEDERRWTPGIYGIPSRFGKIKNLSSFDASFFKIHPTQVHAMDPQLRIMLEVTYEALIDAGVNPFTLKKSRTGVFIGVSSSDANNFWKRKPNGRYILKMCRGNFRPLKLHYKNIFLNTICINIVLFLINLILLF